jgi:hypothetical protein
MDTLTVKEAAVLNYLKDTGNFSPSSIAVDVLECPSDRLSRGGKQQANYFLRQLEKKGFIRITKLIDIYDKD